MADVELSIPDAVAEAMRAELPEVAEQTVAAIVVEVPSYADAFGVFLKHRDAITRVTFWGVSDGDSWLNRGRVNHPLLWDRQRQPKPAFDEVATVLSGTSTSSR